MRTGTSVAEVSFRPWQMGAGLETSRAAGLGWLRGTEQPRGDPAVFGAGAAPRVSATVRVCCVHCPGREQEACVEIQEGSTKGRGNGLKAFLLL